MRVILPDYSKYKFAAFFVAIICCASKFCVGQSQIKDTLIDVLPGKFYALETSNAESIAIKCTTCAFDNSFFLVEDDTIRIEKDPHADQTAFVMIGNTSRGVSFFSGNIADSLHFYFIKVGAGLNTNGESARKSADVCEINAITPKEWRQGLPAPSVKPARTDTRHIIIHHSATENTITDPYLTVRSIYSYHTQVNGWDDIGYNYLIAPDGTIFQGRDDQGLSDADYVLGAHMCGVNAGTMGICMLGSFTDILPTQQALQSLYKLIKWKSEKDNINISNSSLHPIGPPSAGLSNVLLPHVCGHRDGCRPGYTECPGDALYQQIPAIRQQVEAYSCAPSAEAQAMVYPNPAKDRIKINFEWESLRIYNIQGKLIKSYPHQKEEFLSLKGLPNGMYLFHFYSAASKNIVQKIIIM